MTTVDDIRSALKADGIAHADSLTDKEAVNLATITGTISRLFLAETAKTDETDYKASIDRTMAFVFKS